MQVLSKMIDINDDLCYNWNIYFKSGKPDLMKYKHRDLKYICKRNKLYVTGNKSILNDRILEKFNKDMNSCIIQKYVRMKIARNFVSFRGPAIISKDCTNDTDFLTLEPFTNMHIKDFFSFKDIDGFVFGFDFNSIYGLIKRSKTPTNPYNRKEISRKTIKRIKRLRRLNKLYYPKQNIIENTLISDNINEVSVNNQQEVSAIQYLESQRENKSFTERTSLLFYEIDQLGNYTSADWLNELTKNDIIIFVRFLYQMWNYRAGITQDTKQNICPYFNPFNYKGITSNFSNGMNINIAKNMAISVCENMFYTARNDDYKKLSAIYILTALTVANENARQSLPWLYESTL